MAQLSKFRSATFGCITWPNTWPVLHIEEQKKRLKNCISAWLDIIKAPLACQENQKPTDQELKTYHSLQSSHSKPLLMLSRIPNSQRSLADLLVWTKMGLTQSQRMLIQRMKKGMGSLQLALKSERILIFNSLPALCNEHMMLPLLPRERDREEINGRGLTWDIQKEHFVIMNWIGRNWKRRGIHQWKVGLPRWTRRSVKE